MLKLTLLTTAVAVAALALISAAADRNEVRVPVLLKGSFRYQACDDRECYIPKTVPLEWHFRFEGLERERVPEELQRKIR